jgi:multiple sugar transport system ATP-binding protein
MRKISKNEIDKKVRDAAEILNLTELLKRKPKQLSGGQRQRVALGRAIVRNPKVFLMDEPLSNLDAKLRVQMRSEIKKLHEKLQTTFIYVTHDQTEALTMGDRIAIIDKGVIQQIDTPDNVYYLPKNKFVAGFIGSPSMNFIPLNYTDGAVLIENNFVYLPADIQTKVQGKKSFLLGVRPEKMQQSDVDFKFSVSVDMWEILGSEKIAYFEINGAKCCAKLSAEIPSSPVIELGLSFVNAHYFDDETLMRI